MKNLQKSEAFTLAEVLITLGVIGVVAAMTIPSLLTNMRNRDLQVQLNKIYSELNEVSKLYMEEHEEPIPVAVALGKTGVGDILLKYLKGYTDVSSDYYGTKEEDSDGKTVKYQTLKKDPGFVYQKCDVSGIKEDLLGRYFAWDDAPKLGENGPILCVDLNGSRKPNTVGLDYFLFIFTMDGTVIPMGEHHSNNTTLENNLSQNSVYYGANDCIWRNGYTCSYYAIKDKNPKGSGTYWKDYIGKKLYK